MVLGLFEGAALGNAFGSLLSLVTDAVKNVVHFKASLKEIESTILSLKPIFEKIEQQNIVLKRDKEESAKFEDLLTEGEKLVRKCIVKTSDWCVCHKYTHRKKLKAFNKKLVQFQMFLIAILCSDGKETLIKVDINREKLDTILLNNSNNVSVSCSYRFPELPEFVVGLDLAIEEVKVMLLKGDEKVVVISAPGGCGKTTLAQTLCHDPQIQGYYGNNIFFVTVSRTTNLRLIVQKVLQKMNFEVQFETDKEAINHLGSVLKNFGVPVLVVLDDVWSESESLIENFVKFQIPNYKVLVTSRFAFPRFPCRYTLGVLNKDDAMTLFCYWAFKHRETNIPRELVNKVVKSCLGFPLALEVMGGSLCGRHESEWETKMQNLLQLPIDNKILECLQLSIDALDEKLKECFLDLASFPEDQKIPASALRDMWVELYDLDDQNGNNTVKNLLELSTRNLLHFSLASDGPSDFIDNCNEHYATQHDLLRELAIHLNKQEIINQRKRLIMEINGNDHSKWWTKQNHQTFHARLLSITTDENFSSIWPDINLPFVERLVLNFRTKIYSLPRFIKRMSLLKVLIITNNGYFPGELINLPSFGNLDKLKRIRFEYISFSSLYVPQLQSKNLQKISLVTCEIGNTFNKGTLEISSMWPNLEEINFECCTDLEKLPDELCDLVHLKKLCITKCNKLVQLPKRIGKLKNLEALKLHSCILLSSLPESIGSLCKLRALDISDCNRINHLPKSIGKLSEIMMINMKGCEGLDELPNEVTSLVKLQRVICDEETFLLWEYYQRDLSNLEIKIAKEDHNLRWLHNSST